MRNQNIYTSRISLGLIVGLLTRIAAFGVAALAGLLV